MNETYADRRRAAADYIARDDVPEVLRVAVEKELEMLGYVERDTLAMFVQWSDTLTGEVELIARPVRDTNYHLHARGLLPGTELPVDIVVVPNRTEFAALVEEIGAPGGHDVPVTRTQLAKIADPELFDDRAEVTP
ncbi:MAG: hypothetical protein ACRDNK_11840 [Solirubrobacteraceae bacterium]